MIGRTPAFLIAITLGACAPVRLEVPDNLAHSPVAVERHGRQLKIGDYAIVAEPSRSTIHRQNHGGIMQHLQVRATHVFGFVVSVEGDVIDEVSCERVSRASSHTNGVVESMQSRHRLECVFRAPKGAARGYLSMSARQSAWELEGELERASVALEVVPAANLRGADPRTADAFPPAGFTVRLHGVSVGAVQTRDLPAVWIDPRAPPWLKRSIVLAAGVLLLHGDILDAIDRPMLTWR